MKWRIENVDKTYFGERESQKEKVHNQENIQQTIKTRKKKPFNCKMLSYA